MEYKKMLSMTGYGFSEDVFSDFQVSVEVKSLNNRFLDINVKLPYLLNKYDSAMRNIVKKYTKRGKIDIYVSIKGIKHDFNIKPDLDLADKYYETYDKILWHLKSKGLRDNIRLFNILNADGVITIDEKQDTEKIWTGTEQLLKNSLEQLVETKLREGNETKNDLLKIISTMEDNLQEIKNYAQKSIKIYEEKIRTKILELIENVDEERLLQEVAIMSTKIDINEEINRLSTHILLLKDTIEENSSIGRKLDFISQEMHREINTIGSKSTYIEISNNIINMKTLLEQLKEQIRNIE